MKLRAILIGLLLWAAPAFATDGDLVESSNLGSYERFTYLLCDGASGGATRTCSTLDLESTATGRVGMPEFFQVSINADTGCTTPTIQVVGANDSGASMGTVSPPVHEIQSLTAAGTSAATIHAPPFRFVAANLSSATGCTDLEVYLIAYYPKR